LYNPIVKFILKSPLHGLLSDNTLLLTFTGRKSGKAYSTPISYAYDGEMVTLITNRKHGWWKNLEHESPVTMQLRGQAKQGRAQVAQAVPEELIGAMVDVYHGISYEQAAKLAADVVMIKVHLS
jgi:deazaflavin-dependent oxidoreductase (nitroreductase family)